jgi:hypothetical protein
MRLKCLIIILVFVSSLTKAVTITSIIDGNWEDASTWSNHQVPTNPDSIIIQHYVVLNQNRTLSSPTILFITSTGTICGDYLLETLCGVTFINYGHMYLGSIETRSGYNYNLIFSKIYINVYGCSPSVSGFYSYPPNGVVQVWPPVFCKTIDTNWEGGTSIGVMELENNQLKIYPSPLTNEPLTVITLTDTKIKLLDVMGREIQATRFENKLEIDVSTLPTGIYFLEIEMNGKKQLKKVVKSN